MAKFSEIWKARSSAVATLFTDNLSFHRDVDPIVTAKENLVQLVFLPPNTSHFLQPLDDLVFARYKSHLARLARELLSAISGEGTKRTAAEIITAVTAAAEKIAFKPEVTQESFKNCGLWPLKFEKIMEMAYLNIGKTREAPSPPSPGRKSRKEYRRDVARVVMELNGRSSEIAAQSKNSNKRVTPTVEYETLYDSDSIIANSERTQAARAESARLKGEKQIEKEKDKERRESLKQERRIIKEKKAEEKAQQLREKRNIDAAKEVRGVGTKRKRADPPDLELDCIVKDCSLTWNTADESNWMFCESCDACCVCEGHWRDGEGKAVLTAHETRCPHRPRKRAKRDEDSE